MGKKSRKGGSVIRRQGDAGRRATRRASTSTPSLPADTVPLGSPWPPGWHALARNVAIWDEHDTKEDTNAAGSDSTP